MMREATILIHEQLEETHWWFEGRRHVLLALLQRFVKPENAYLLEAGCGTGGNLKYLAANGYRAVGLEPNARMAAVARRRTGCRIYENDLVGGLEAVSESINAVLLLDVLEHIEDDSGALRAVNAHLPAGGTVVVTVPAFPFLWSYHDESFGHQRRYTMAGLRDKLKASGFSVVWISYFNSLLFPLAVCVRVLRGVFGAGEHRTDFWQPPWWLNALLARMLTFEGCLVGRLRSPVGLSLQAVAQKT